MKDKIKVIQLTIATMLTTVGVILGNFSIKLPIFSVPALRIDIVAIPIILAGLILGKWYGMGVGIVIDILNFLLYGQGVYHVGFTINYALIGLFSGLRANEICSLYLDNVKTFEGNKRRKVWCFNILEESPRPDKKLKNRSSRRIVPIHDTLIDLGFLDFLKLIKSRNPERKRVFEELPFREGSYFRNVTRFFNERYLPKLGIKKPTLSFHSLRHTTIDNLKQKGIDIHFINAMMGHSQGNIDLDRYGKGYNPDIIYNKCVKHLHFETSHARGIDFNPLKLNWKKDNPIKCSPVHTTTDLG